MSIIHISPMAHEQVIEYLRGKGHIIVFPEKNVKIDPAVALHPDLQLCRLGAGPDAKVVRPVRLPSGEYPGDAAMCAVCMGNYLIHRPDITDTSVTNALPSAERIPVAQGYTRCSCAVVDDSSLITADRGIIAALKPVSAIDVLPVQKGSVELPGYSEGFLGGACGRVGNEIIWNGDLSRHPDAEKIRHFVEQKGLLSVDFPGLPLVDIGGIMEETFGHGEKLELSCGALVCRKTSEGRQYLMVKHNAGHWAFPKGHIERGETERQCAVREIREETGIVSEIRSEFRAVREFSPKKGVWKRVVYFLAEAVGGSERAQQEEVSSVKWLSAEEVLRRLTYESDRELLRQAEAYAGIVHSIE